MHLSSCSIITVSSSCQTLRLHSFLTSDWLQVRQGRYALDQRFEAADMQQPKDYIFLKKKQDVLDIEAENISDNLQSNVCT